MDPHCPYYLLLIDLKQSTDLTPGTADRIFAQLEETLEQLPETLEAPPILGPQISYGDEIAALFEQPNSIHQAILSIRRTLWPEAAFRFAVAWGHISRDHEDIRQVSGDIFKQANTLIERLKTDNAYGVWSLQDPVLSGALTALTATSHALLASMTAYQYEVYTLLSGGLSQKAIARKLGKYPQSVSDAVKRGYIEEVIQAENAIEPLLARASMEKD